MNVVSNIKGDRGITKQLDVLFLSIDHTRGLCIVTVMPKTLNFVPFYSSVVNYNVVEGSCET